MTSRTVRTIAVLLLASVTGAATAQSAPPAQPESPAQYDKLIHKLTSRGTGHGIRIEERDGTEIKGVLVSFDTTGLQVIAPKATAPVHIDYSNVRKIGNTGMSTGAKIGAGVLIGFAAFIALVLILAAIALHG